MKMKAFEISRLVEAQRRSGSSWLEFFRVPVLSMGIYSLQAGGADPQTPHHEDEVYYVVSGRASIQVGDEDRALEPGSLVFVAGEAKHKFPSIKEDLTVLVFFAPAVS